MWRSVSSSRRPALTGTTSTMRSPAMSGYSSGSAALQAASCASSAAFSCGSLRSCGEHEDQVRVSDTNELGLGLLVKLLCGLAGCSASSSRATLGRFVDLQTVAYLCMCATAEIVPWAITLAVCSCKKVVTMPR